MWKKISLELDLSAQFHMLSLNSFREVWLRHNALLKKKVTFFYKAINHPFCSSYLDKCLSPDFFYTGIGLHVRLKETRSWSNHWYSLWMSAFCSIYSWSTSTLGCSYICLFWYSFCILTSLAQMKTHYVKWNGVEYSYNRKNGVKPSICLPSWSCHATTCFLAFVKLRAKIQNDQIHNSYFLTLLGWGHEVTQSQKFASIWKLSCQSFIYFLLALRIKQDYIGL